MRRLFALAAAAWLTGSAVAQLPLRPLRFALEQKTTFDVTTMTELNLGLAGARTELTLRVSMEAIEVDGDKTRLRITWDEVFGEIAIRLMTIRFDSTKDVKSSTYKTGQPLADRLGSSIVDDIKAPHLALKGFEYDVIVDARGAIVDVPDLGEKLDAFRKRMKKVSNPKMVRGFMTEEGVRWQVRMLVPAQPAEGAKIGDAWKHPAVLGLGNSGMGRVETDIRCDLKSTDKEKATIEWSGTPAIHSPKIHVKESALKGSQVLSMDDGLPLSVEAEFELDVVMKSRIGAMPQKLACDYEVVRIKK